MLQGLAVVPVLPLDRLALFHRAANLFAHSLHLALDLLVDLALELLHLFPIAGAELVAHFGPLGLELSTELLHAVELLLAGLHGFGHLLGLTPDLLALLGG